MLDININSKTALKIFIANKILQLMHRSFTIETTVHSKSQYFYFVTKYLADAAYTDNARTLQVDNGRNGGNDTTVSLGCGTHLISFKNNFILIKREIIKEQMHLEERITLTTFGRSQKVIKMFLEEITPNKEDSKKITKIQKWQKDYWSFLCEQPARSFDTVYLEESAKKQILNALDNFSKDKEWNRSKGIPDRLTFLFEGPPGTGKTATITALCQYLGRELYLLNLKCSEDQLSHAIANAPPNCIISIEDVDTYSVSQKRKKISNEKEERLISLSGLLNALDGALASNDRIIVLTTNHIEKLDKALTRKGRVDEIVHIGYCKLDQFRIMLDAFYPDSNIKINAVPDKLCPAQIQSSAKENRGNVENFLKSLKIKKYTKRRKIC